MTRRGMARKFALGVLAVATLAGLGSIAQAGLKYTGPVYVYPSSHYASGGVGYARNTGSTNDYIGCSISQYATSVSMYCGANDTSNNYVGCSTTNAAFIAAARSIGPDSQISFSADASGNCNYLYVEYYSWNQPKVP
jgi:hypothetical protein